MKIGILYICTGKYDIFWKDFYLSAEKHFLKGHEIHYFVFTDAEKLFDEENNERIHKIFQRNIGWPGSTLMRFHIFLAQKNVLEKMDYLFFCNADLLIVKDIYELILPKLEGIIVCQHPSYFNKNKHEFPYERNKESTASIGENEGIVYVQGALNGGKSIDFLSMCATLSSNIDIDLKKGLTAKWHDESHLNKYILNTRYKLLDPSYLFPEGSGLKFDCKIMIRNKLLMPGFGYHYILQGRNFSFIQKIYFILSTMPIFRILLGYFRKKISK